jgi:hypothetical protein
VTVGVGVLVLVTVGVTVFVGVTVGVLVGVGVGDGGTTPAQATTALHVVQFMYSPTPTKLEKVVIVPDGGDVPK